MKNSFFKESSLGMVEVVCENSLGMGATFFVHHSVKKNHEMKWVTWGATVDGQNSYIG